MGKKGHPEVYCLIDRGMKPKKLIEIGYSKATVYNYFFKYRRFVKPKIDKVING